MKRWIRRGLWSLAIALTIAAVAAAAFWFGRHWAAERVILAALEERGVEASLTVAELDEGSAVLADVTLGAEPALRADRVAVTYDLARIGAGILDTIEIDGAVLRMRVDAEGASLGELDPLLGDGAEGASVPLPRTTLRDSRMELETPLGPATVALDGTLTPDASGGFAAAGSSQVHSAHLDLTADFEVEGTFQDMTASLTIADGRANWPDGTLDALGGTARAAIVQGGFASAQAALNAGGGHAAGVPIDGATLSAETAGGKIDVALFATAEDGDIDIELNAAADVGASPMAVTADGMARLARTGDALAALGMPELRDVEVEWTLSGNGDTAAMDGTLSVDMAAAELRLPGLVATGPTGRYDGRFAWKNGELAFHTDKPLALRLEDASVTGIGALDAPLALSASAVEGPLVAVRLSDGEPSITLQMRFAETPFALTADGTRMRGTLPAATVAGAGGALSVTTEGGRIELPDDGIVAAGIGASYDTDWRRGELRIDLVRDMGSPAAFAPAVVTGEIGRDGLVWTVDGTAWAARGRLAARISARHDPETGQGGVEWHVPTITFAPDALQPAALLPALEGVVERAKGTVSARGTLRWGGDGTRIRFAADLADATLEAGGVPIQGLTGTVRYDNRDPDPPFETLRIARATLGMPLTETTAEIRLLPDFTVELRALDGQFAGGRIFSDGFSIDPRATVQEFVLQVEGVSLGRLLEIADVPGLGATGTVSGRIPVRIEDGDVIVQGGALSSTGGGTLAYTPEEPPAALAGDNQGVELMMQAFENFRYDALTAEIHKEPGGETEVLLHLSGRNPDALDGQLFNFNINLSGNATEIMNCLLGGECGTGGGLRLDQ